ncbi:glutathione binding-like protein [Hydrocoleum sp. CS-953]|uniref:glutathione binding-like protein n=1 Tax=Hydrocoleum sp. CS-953 TaxID=1671698 RepID=UPI003529DA19
MFFGGIAGKEEEILENFQKLKVEFTMLNDNISADENWLAGDKLSAADIAIYPVVRFVEKLAAQEDVSKLNLDILPIQEKYPKLGNLVQKIDEMPNVESLYPPDWR